MTDVEGTVSRAWDKGHFQVKPKMVWSEDGS